MKEEKGVKLDTELTAEDLKELVDRFKTAVKKVTGKDFPSDPWEQLWGAICCSFRQLDERPCYLLPQTEQYS